MFTLKKYNDIFCFEIDYIYYPGLRFVNTPFPSPYDMILKFTFWNILHEKRGICNISCTMDGWYGPQTCKFVGFPATDLPKMCYLKTDFLLI